MHQLLIATGNSHKTAEIRAMLGAEYEVSDLKAHPELPVVEETGTTFLENATLKAVEISRQVAGLVMADDSGLEVDALGGARHQKRPRRHREPDDAERREGHSMDEAAAEEDRRADDYHGHR